MRSDSSHSFWNISHALRAWLHVFRKKKSWSEDRSVRVSDCGRQGQSSSKWGKWLPPITFEGPHQHCFWIQFNTMGYLWMDVIKQIVSHGVLLFHNFSEQRKPRIHCCNPCLLAFLGQFDLAYCSKQVFESWTSTMNWAHRLVLRRLSPCAYFCLDSRFLMPEDYCQSVENCVIACHDLELFAKGGFGESSFSKKTIPSQR